MLKIDFKVSQKYDVEIMKRFLLPRKGDWDWRNYAFFFYKDLKNILKNKPGEKRRRIEDYIKNFYTKHLKDLEKRKGYFEKSWERLNDKYEKIICELLEIDSKKVHFKITCFVSICPICPRNLRRKNFSVFCKQNLEEARLTVAHEILHFYYFYKWRKVFPKHSEKNFDGPHIIWHLSEILAIVLLNTKNLQKILRKKANGYKEYENLTIKDLRAIDYFNRLFKRHKGDFSDFLKKAYKEAIKYKKEIMKI